MHRSPEAALRHLIVALLIVAFAGILAACTDGSPAPAETSDGPVTSTSVDVSAFEYGYTASTDTVPAGEVTFTLLNTGGMAHDLVIEGVDGAATAIIGPTETDAFTVTLEPGTYTLYCSVGTHRDLGMELEITVT
ncbi:cupredoxin domain-containing protein [Demequina sp. SYSU T00039]|uniref:Cupredoxin domain-containing protein n=1 Tax=Demequina lignilytica TaxID=3051663 RepID=A0AAW7MA65_9MICO|nr:MULTISPECIES: cupredoxin domain-containing protein [unclassified Demequina]MDN4478609.1 cupredoxin domain-containing protein [Demequina sp. SYSU T00039-1]MDN4488587.1 cupredoxin domain-containing protein [Demequina sp. SYSU T00039]MDN4491613.1 cupredoxin domain-containing protein [Demequina sp. SYSU T00068]